jgi:hypothetical protein
VTFTGLQLLETHCGVGGDRVNQLVNFRRAFPVVLESVVTDDRVLLVGNELERTGTDGGVIDGFLGAERMEAKSIARFEINGASGWFSVNLTV